MTIKDEWQSYLRDVMSKEAGDIQKKETELAFYAGAAACFKIFTEEILFIDDFDLQKVRIEIDNWINDKGYKKK